MRARGLGFSRLDFFGGWHVTGSTLFLMLPGSFCSFECCFIVRIYMPAIFVPDIENGMTRASVEVLYLFFAKTFLTVGFTQPLHLRHNPTMVSLESC